ncbi:L domain-like protein [Ceratobasidium sp. AG-I]|nr:L domain-like protein [Ceratobasidium sp. AG-I]
MSRAIFGPAQITPTLTPWRALNVEKQPGLPTTAQGEHTVNVSVRADSEAGVHKCSCKHTDPRRKRNRMCWCLIIILLILLATIDVIFLNVRVLNPDFGIIVPSASPAPTNLARETSTVTAPAVNCLTQFQINAPSSPSSFPCDTCFSALSSAPANSNAGSAMQFCAMKAIFDSAGSSGSANSGALSTAGWMRDAKPCGWSGVQCDSNGNVASIVLTFPGVPAAIPSELSSISTLTSLKITGDGNLPAGALPVLNSLTTLDIENTALSALSDDTFTSAKSLVSLTLVRNSKMGTTLPSSVGSLSLKSLIVNGQSLASFGPIFTSSSLASSLQTIDLSSNSITASLPSDLSTMSALAELNLSANNIAAPFPTAMPSTLQVLSLEGNAKLSGALPSSLCSSTTLAQCDLKNTGLDSTTPCGVCTFA